MMKICASLSGESDIDAAGKADMVEVRTDLLDRVPDIPTEDMLVTFRGPVDLDILPAGFSGRIDIGEEKRPETDLGVISSHHDYEATPDAEGILSVMPSEGCDISKGAFTVRDFRDLVEIREASYRIGMPHVILGMGALGTVTRIRQSLLGNEFTFAYVGEPTAPGQLSVDEMSELTDDSLVFGIVGNPVSRSRSPAMQNAALESCGIDGIYLPFGSPDLDGVEDFIRGYDIRGVNVTIPYKTDIMDHLDSVDGPSSEICAVNTVVNRNGRLEGHNTDVTGIGIALQRAGIETDGARVLIMGSGGAAKACAYHMSENGADVTVTGRNRDTGNALAHKFGCAYREPLSVPVRMYDLVVNCTPVGMYYDGPYPVDVSLMEKGQAVFDMVYGKTTPIVSHARENGCAIADGGDMLAGQGAASFRLWTGEDRDVFDIMRSRVR